MEGKLPEGWRWRKLEDLAKFIYGCPFESSKFNSDGKGLPIIRIRNLIAGATEMYYDGYYDENYIVNNDEILIGMDGEFNIVKWNGGKALLNQRICKLEFISTEIIPDFAYRSLVKILKQIEDKTPQVTVKHLSAKRMKDIQIPLPPRETQRRIVAILEKAEETRMLRTQADEMASRLLQSVFFEMFGDPVRNPNGWKKLRLGEILVESPQNGLYKPENAYGGGTPILRIDSFYNGKITNINQLKRLKCTKEEIRKFGLKIGDILINRVNSLEYLGKCGLVQALVEDTVYESNMMRIRVRTDIITPVFLTRYLCLQYIKNQILSSSKKAVNQASINQGDVESLNILIPPIPLQEKFVKIFRFVETLQQSQKQSHQNIENIFGSILQKAFTGELVG
jgi:type I restriction enzyme S subunit